MTVDSITRGCRITRARVWRPDHVGRAFRQHVSIVAFRLILTADKRRCPFFLPSPVQHTARAMSRHRAPRWSWPTAALLLLLSRDHLGEACGANDGDHQTCDTPPVKGKTRGEARPSSQCIASEVGEGSSCGCSLGRGDAQRSTAAVDEVRRCRLTSG